jgi:hypothetical protein
MALAESANLVARLSLQDNFTGPLARAEAGLGRASSGIGRLGGAVQTAGGHLKGLITGPLGLLGLTGGLLTLGGALRNGVEKAQDFGDEVRKISAVTGLSAEQTSALAAALEHFGVGADKAIRLTGFLEKNVGLLAARKDGLAAFSKTYGLALTDQNGKLKDANELILTTADYFNNNAIPATEKAAALSKLYGRSWQDMIPFLKAGRQGIADAEDEAAKLGLTLSKDNVDALAKMKTATRDLGTAVGGLELQIGLALVPALTDLAKVATTFVTSHRGDIVAFFKGAADAARTAAGVIGDVAGAVSGFWNKIPPGFRDLLLKGFVADRTVKFLFGFDPIKAVLGGAGGLFSRGSSPANPLYVTGTGIGGLPGGGGSGGGLPLLGLGGLILAGVAAGEIGLADQLRKILHPTTSGDLIQNYSASEAADYHSGRKSVEDIMAERAAITAGFAGANAREDRANFELQAVNSQLVNIHQAIKDSIGKLDDRLKHPLLPHSKVNAELHAALRIAKSSESTDKKITDLQKINRDLVAGGHKTSHYVQDLIAVEKRKRTSFHITIPISISARNSIYRISATGRMVSDSFTSSTLSRSGVST